MMDKFGLGKSTFTVRGIIDRYNTIVATVISVLSAIFSEFWFLFVAFFIFNILDWLSGWMKSRKLKTESSYAGLKGIVKKLWYWVLIAVAFAVSFAFVSMGSILGVNLEFLFMIGFFTLACLLVNEARSICENLVQMGVHVPGVLVKGLAVASKLIKDKAEAQVPDIPDADTDAPTDSKE